MFNRRLAAAASLVLAGCGPAASAPAITVTDAWARASAPGQSSAAVYATIVNRSGPDRLIGVSSSTGVAMLHGNPSSGGVVRMRMLSELPVPAAGRAVLAPGGTHVMLSNLAAPLEVGGDLRVTFRFAASPAQTVAVAIVAPGAR